MLVRLIGFCAVSTFAGLQAQQVAQPTHDALLEQAVAATGAEVLAAAPDAAWRTPEPENLVIFSLPGGDLVIELADQFAPRHAAELRTLVRAGRFDGGAVVRSQDNYVAQWTTRPDSSTAALGGGSKAGLRAEFERASAGLPWTPLADRDPYAGSVGWVDGFPAARDLSTGTTWPVHCYGAVGVARDTSPDSADATQLYAVTGHAPRHLDRNLTIVGRVVLGMSRLSTLPRGGGALGFYESDDEQVPIEQARLAIDLPPEQRPRIQLLDTGSETFRSWVATRRHRTEAFFVTPARAIDLCNVPLPTR